MSRHPLIKQKDFLSAAQVFHWATREHFVMWFTGKVGRHRRTEVILPRLVRHGKLRSLKYGNRLVYCAPRRSRGQQLFVEHGLGCTEGLVRIWRSQMNCLIIPERYFKGFGNVPEWGIRYPSGKLLIFEFCTSGNFVKPGLINNKIMRYKVNIPAIEGRFNGEVVVLFVANIPRRLIQDFIERFLPEGPFLFSDYLTFKSVPFGDQLIASIYFWGQNGREYPLKYD